MFEVLLSKDEEVSDRAFFVRINEMSLALPCNHGRGFHEWWWGRIVDEIQPHLQGLTVEMVEEWQQGKHLPYRPMRKFILETAHQIVSGDGMSEKDFYKLVSYSYRFMTEKWFAPERRRSEVLAWAIDLFLFKASTESGYTVKDLQGWLKREGAPPVQYRLMVARIVAYAAMEAIGRDDCVQYQKYTYNMPQNAA